MRFNRSASARWALNAAALALGLVSTFTGCASLTGPQSASSSPVHSPCADCVPGKMLYAIAGFGCIGGSECTGRVQRGEEGCECPMQVVDYQIDVIVRDRTVEVKTGRISFARGDRTAGLEFATTTTPEQLTVKLFIDGHLISQDTVIPTMG